ncbi:unnamed protein product [Lasius platythorax]|uniref:Uncharacterized protein n=1 Tax=Lasius platythorax TaxID=488582 RepID=A0AAV2N8F3_9HYME
MPNSRERWTGWLLLLLLLLLLSSSPPQSVAQSESNTGRTRLFARDDETCLPDLWSPARNPQLETSISILAGQDNPARTITSKIFPSHHYNQPALATAPASQPQFNPYAFLKFLTSLAHRTR